MAFVAFSTLDLGPRPSWLVALAVLTPSAGFILDSLDSFGLSEQGRFWTKSEAIVPRSEFAFLLMLALVCAHATRRLGVYYLVGAFLVGVAARQFEKRLPAISSEKMLHAVEAFASIFVPFYFFDAGLRLDAAGIGLRSIMLAAILLAVAIPFRLAQVGIHQRVALGVSDREGLRVGVSLLPTLVSSLVLADILRERFAISEDLYAGLVLYALVNTLLPGLFLHTPPPDYDAPYLSEPDWDALAAARHSRPPPEGL